MPGGDPPSAIPDDALRVRPSASVRTAAAGDERVLLDLEGGVYFTLNDSGALLWDRISAGASLGELRDALVEGFEVEAAEAAADVAELVGELRAAGLVVVEPD